MAEIVETLAADRRLRLYNEDFARKLGIGTAWTKLRIGIRLSIQATSAVNTSRLVFGVCQGDTLTFKNAATTDFIGALFGAAVSNTYAFNAGPPTYVSTGQMPGISRIGNTNVLVSPSSATVVITATPSVRSLLFVDIEKNFTNNKIVCYATNPAGAVVDATLAQLMTYMEADVPTSNAIIQNFVLSNIPYSGAGLWDTLNISWNNANAPIEISDIIVMRIY
jgi:hypothetical protein